MEKNKQRASVLRKYLCFIVYLRSIKIRSLSDMFRFLWALRVNSGESQGRRQEILLWFGYCWLLFTAVSPHVEQCWALLNGGKGPSMRSVANVTHGGGELSIATAPPPPCLI